MNSALFGTYGKVLAQLKALDVNDPDVRRRPTMREASLAGAVGTQLFYTTTSIVIEFIHECNWSHNAMLIQQVDSFNAL